MTTSDLKPGQSGKVVRIFAAPEIKQRLLDMGILPNVRVQMERTTITGDPIWIRVQDYQLSLRKSEALGVVVEVDEQL